MAPITWNRRTGYIVGGHQRLAALDALEGHDDYTLTVAEVDLDDKAEREQNVFLNNPSTQGEWDLGLLEQLLLDQEHELTVENLGFDHTELQLLIDNPKISAMFADENDAAKPTIEEIQQIKESRRKARERAQDVDDPEFFVVVVFPSRAEVVEFLRRYELPEDARYIDGIRLANQLEGR